VSCRIHDRVDCVLEDDLLRGVFDALLGKPAAMREAPVAVPAEDAPVTKQKRQNLPALLAQIGRRLTRPHQVPNRRMDTSGTHIGVSSPARSNRASLTASRRLVLIRSPGFLGRSDGATTVQSWPSA
jgi:hypothetical protein